MTTAESAQGGGGSPWLSPAGSLAGVDDAGVVLRAWRLGANRTQTYVAAALDTTQQHVSQIENGQCPLSLEQRRKMVTELGIAAEDLGLSAGHARRVVSHDDASPEIAASRLRWRNERRWLNRHRSELAQLAVQFYPLIGDPFDPGRRAITTMTVRLRRYPAEPSFLLH